MPESRSKPQTPAAETAASPQHGAHDARSGTAAVSDHDATRLSDAPAASIDRTEVRTAPAKEAKAAAHPHPALSVEEELLRELKQMNRQLGHLTQGYRRYTLSFFSGIVRGLGAAIGATVVFAVFLAAVSRLDTTPLIGNYVKRIVGVVHNSGPGTSGNMMEFDPGSRNPFMGESEATLEIDSDPTGAKILIDGRDVGKKTPVDDLEVAPGHHELKLVLGAASVTLPLEARAGETLKLGAPKLSPAAAASAAPTSGEASPAPSAN